MLRRSLLSASLFLLVIPSTGQLLAQTNLNAPAQESTNAALPERLRLLEERVTVAMAIKDERIENATAQLGNLYLTFQTFAAIAGVVLVVFTVRDFSFRARERQRQLGIDEIIKETLSLQRAAAQQQVDVGRARVTHEDRNIGQQLEAMEKVNAVIEVVRRTLDFRQQQEAKVATALTELEKLTAERERNRRHKLSQAIAINEHFSRISRMEFAALSDEQQKRGRRLLALADDLDLAQHSKEDVEAFGPMLMTCGAVAYYDNDVIEAKEYFDAAVECRLGDHAGALRADEKYRKRFAVLHYFRSLVHKNWGDLSSALYEIEQSVELFGDAPDEYLSPVTKAEIHTYIPGNERLGRRELETLLRRLAAHETRMVGEGKGLNANQKRLRRRILLLLGNTYFLESNFSEGLAQYDKAIDLNNDDYYALCSAAQCLLAQGKGVDAAARWERCLGVIERVGDHRRRRELSTRAVVGATAFIAARGSGNLAGAALHMRELAELLTQNLSVDGMTPRFFSPLTKRLVSAEGLLASLSEGS